MGRRAKKGMGKRDEEWKEGEREGGNLFFRSKTPKAKPAFLKANLVNKNKEENFLSQ